MKSQEINEELHVSHEEHRDLMDENERLRKEIDTLKASVDELHSVAAHDETAGHVDEKVLIDKAVLRDILTDLTSCFGFMGDSNLELTMTDAQRSRLLGAGVRRYGFIKKTAEVALENPQFVPGFFTQADLDKLSVQIDTLRNIMAVAQQILRIMTDHYLLTSDEAFRLARLYYVSVRDAARNGIPGALPIFNILRPLFRRSSIRTDEQPTVPEIENDVKALLHGRKDGKIMIEAEGKHKTASHREVLDETYKPKGAFKEKTQGMLCGQCGEENGSDYKFCRNCGNKF